jgi:hypothetical protein
VVGNELGYRGFTPRVKLERLVRIPRECNRRAFDVQTAHAFHLQNAILVQSRQAKSVFSEETLEAHVSPSRQSCTFEGAPKLM